MKLRGEVLAIAEQPETSEVGIIVQVVETGLVDLLVYDKGKEPPVKVGDVVDLICDSPVTGCNRTVSKM